MRSLFLFLLAVFLLCSKAHSSEPRPEDHHLLYVGSGVFNVIRNKKYLNFLVEYRAKSAWYRDKHVFIRPLISASLNNRMGVFIGIGLACDLFLTPSVVLTPSFAPGGYFKGKSFDLGYPLEFRSAIELSWTNHWGCRFGTMFYHLSNASLADHNPGAEVFMFFLGIPLGEH
ncbi:MAG: acyloxyacyl hydrolase [Chlamydiota bacterium]